MCIANDPLSLRGHGNKYLAVDAGGPPSLLRSPLGLSLGRGCSSGTARGQNSNDAPVALPNTTKAMTMKQTRNAE
jgi:hypothetical protein